MSSGDQQPARQLDQVAVDWMFIEYASGKDLERPQLAQLLAFVRPGDTVVVHSPDCFCPRVGCHLDASRPS